jgi:hypothetical protein
MGSPSLILKGGCKKEGNDELLKFFIGAGSDIVVNSIFRVEL